MTLQDEKLALELKNRLLQIGGNRIDRILFFGSRVHNQARADSDLDVAVVVMNPTSEFVDMLEDAAYQLMLEYNFSPIISLKIFNKSRYNKAIKKGYSFYKLLESEGIEL